MKNWLTRNGRNLLATAAICISFALGWFAGANATDRKAYAALWEAMAVLPDPEQCALCGEGMRHHAPCLMDLSTGQMGELKVYTDHPTRQGELAPSGLQQTGTFTLFPCAGLRAIQDTCAHTCEVVLPQERDLMDPAHFCGPCRQLLAEAGLEGYVLVDLYDLEHIRAYPIPRRGTEIIRDYRISVSNRQENGLTLHVTGLSEMELPQK